MMISRTKKIASLLALCGVLALGVAVGFAQGPMGGPHGGHGPHGERGGIPFARELNLTDAQKEQIKKIMDSFEASTKELHDKLKALHESQPDPLTGTFDEAAVRSAAQARAAIEVELEVAHARAMSQMAAVLTDEQKAQLAAHHKQFERRHEGPPPPPPGDNVPDEN